MLQRSFHQHVKHVQCFVHPVVHLTSIVGMTSGMSKIDQLGVLVVPFFPHVLLVCDEHVNLS